MRKSTQQSCCHANDETDGASTIHTQEQEHILGNAQAHALLQKCLFVRLWGFDSGRDMLSEYFTKK